MLTPRDEALLRALARFRMARTSDLGRLFFPGRNRDVLAARLRRLFDARFLEAHVLDRAAENVYSLGPAGREQVRIGGASVGGPPRSPWAHHLGVVRLWSEVAGASHATPGIRLTSFCPDWEFRERRSDPPVTVVPDALFEVQGPVTVRVAAEVDRGTESLETLRRKLRLYADHRLARDLFGWPDFELVLVLQDAGVRRERSVRGLLLHEWPGPLLLWTKPGDAAAWFRSLGAAPVAPSRCGDGRNPGVTADAASATSATGEGPSEDA